MDVEPDKTRLNKSFNTYIDELASYLMNLPNSSVSIRLAIDISAPEGIPEDLKGVVSENCHTLKVRNLSAVYQEEHGKPVLSPEIGDTEKVSQVDSPEVFSSSEEVSQGQILCLI